ncbi:MAG: hypothetical protein IKO75_14350, partial [Bacteroidales bacterium]|nr:hypothetical protein [Bacteroidales bacterium]
SNGCDSIVTLTVNQHQVHRDTMYKDTLYAGVPYITEFANHEFTVTESGVLTYTDTLPGSNGCDSITTRILIVEEPHHDTICDRTFTPAQTWQDNIADYCWYANGTANCIAGMAPDAQGFYEFPGQREIDGRVVDTVSYLMLTVKEISTGDTTAVACESFDWYEHTGITTSTELLTHTFTNANGCDSVVTLHLAIGHSSTGDTTAVACESFIWHGITYTESGDYPSYMSNSSGCDSVVTLHLTVNHSTLNVTSHTDEVCGDDGSVTVAAADGLAPIEYSLDGVTYQSSNVFDGLSDGSYTIHATDANGCEATTTVTIAPAPIAMLNLTCPPTHYDTLAYGDCVMEIYPAEFGTPTATIYPAEWPFEITNDIPADNLYYEGSTKITYTMTDQVCGNTVTCDQYIVVVFPQCPDAIDCEGNVYHGVRVGCDCWTQTNLQSNCYGEPNECVVTGTCEDPIPCVYEYESDRFPDVDQNVGIYGRLYCAEAALDDSVVNENGHIQGICPEGWYLPTPEQYEQLYLYGGGTSILTADGLRSPLYWFDGGGNNATGFSALPAGIYNGATQQYERMTLDTYFWATEIIHGEVRSAAYKITYDCNEIQRTDIDFGYGISVRCIKEKD